MQDMTLSEMYEKTLTKKRELPPTPSQAFIAEVAEVAHKSELTVRRWLARGEKKVLPDYCTQKILADHFGTTPEALFPTA